MILFFGEKETKTHCLSSTIFFLIGLLLWSLKLLLRFYFERAKEKEAKRKLLQAEGRAKFA
ncbi:MAG: hypothetical protein ACI38V_06675 [Bacteroides sp.]